MNKLSKKLLLVNTFGAFGYLTCIFLWGWLGVIYLPMILANEQIEKILIQAPKEEAAPVINAPESSPALAIFAVIVTVVVIIITVIVLLRAPVSVAKTGKAVTNKAASTALPIITKGRKIPANEKRQLTAQLVKLIKLLITLLPFIAVLIGTFFTLPLPLDLAILVSGVFALVAVFWFSLQYIFARFLSVPLERLV